MSLSPNPHSPPTTNSQPTTTTTTKQQNTPPPSQIDTLLQHYLTLLDAYTTQRAALHAQQTALFQNLARANSLEAGRGVSRYGQDWYDGRMQAGRRVRIGKRGSGEGEEEEGGGEKQGDGGSREAAVFSVEVYPQQSTKEEKTATDQEPKATNTTDDQQDNNDNTTSLEDTPPTPQPPADTQPNPNPKPSTHKEDPETDPENTPKDPLKWFGILTPLPLRQAQSHAIAAVEEIIPRLATLSAEMAAVELEVRRARKRRAKAEKVARTGTERDERGEVAGGENGGKEEDREKVVAELGEKLGRVDVTA